MITGGAGFIGCHLARRLAGACDVVVVDNLSGDSVGEVPAGVESHEVDIRDIDALRDLMRGCDAVVHLASSVLIKGGHLDTHQDLRQNLTGTFSVLEAMRQTATGHICFASSSTVYGAHDSPRALDERTPLRPISLYSAAKAAGEAYISAYSHLFGLSASVLRLGIVLGPGLRRGAAFDFVQRLRADPTRLTILGGGQQMKPYLDIDDCIAGFVQLGLAPCRGVEIFNIASEGAISVTQVVKQVLEVLGLDGIPVSGTSQDAGWPGDVPRLELGVDRARAAGWSCRYSAEEAVRRYVQSLIAGDARSKPGIIRPSDYTIRG